MQINYTLKRLKGWMKPGRRRPTAGPARASGNAHGPSGVVASWCPSDAEPQAPHQRPRAARQPTPRSGSPGSPLTPPCCILLDEALGSDGVVIEGDRDHDTFGALPSTIIFTGSTAVVGLVMAAAAWLTPLTHGLGGRALSHRPDVPWPWRR